ncbi:hypothetical protein ACFWPX_18270 [Nocardia sp. NPDC058518]|uniref:hypothetical protein n=1 Tax=Nocardia sp. NPDC058518 TaxID=3346534 RepID=UPI003669AAC3
MLELSPAEVSCDFVAVIGEGRASIKPTAIDFGISEISCATGSYEPTSKKVPALVVTPVDYPTVTSHIRKHRHDRTPEE